MTNAQERPLATLIPWFETWFDSNHYRKLYAHRNEGEAVRFLDELLERLRPDRGSSMLDLGCGEGRHAKYLAAKGYRVTGMDLAATSVRAARRFEGPTLRFVRHDMRLPFGTSAFDYAFNFFTSFGYFEAKEHHDVVRNLSDCLRAGGRVVVDYLNVHHAEAHLTPEEEKVIDGTTYRLTRWTDDGHFFKRIAVDDGSGRTRVHVERVAKLTFDDFERMFALHGLSVEQTYGDYNMGSFDRERSPRLILVARKSSPDERSRGLRAS